MNRTFFSDNRGKALTGAAMSVTGVMVMGLIYRNSDISPSLALPFFVFVTTTAWGGLDTAIFNCVLLVAFNFYYFYPDTSRILQNIPGNVIILLTVGFLRRYQIQQSRLAVSNQSKADFVDNLNGNINRIRTARVHVLDILKTHPLALQTVEELNSVLHVLNNLELATAGWIALDKLKHEIKAEREAEAGPPNE